MRSPAGSGPRLSLGVGVMVGFNDYFTLTIFLLFFFFFNLPHSLKYFA
jgi:hypothetical protein